MAKSLHDRAVESLKSRRHHLIKESENLKNNHDERRKLARQVEVCDYILGKLSNEGYEAPKQKTAAQIWYETEERCEQRTLEYLDKLIAEKNAKNT